MAESAPPLTATAKASDEEPATARSMAARSGAEPNCDKEISGTSLLVAPIGHEPLESLIDKLLGSKARHLPQGVGQSAAELARHDDGVAVRAAHGFVDHAIDQPEVFEARRGNRQGLGRDRSLVGAAPKNR